MIRRVSLADVERFKAGILAKTKRTRKPAAYVVPEANVQETCDGLLERDGWRIVITDPKRLRGLGVTEKGIADTLGIRYRHAIEVAAIQEIRRAVPEYVVDQTAAQLRALADILWVEWKTIKGKTAEKQHEWHFLERGRGALTWKAGEDFEPTIEGFMDHYNASGLAINRMRIGAR